MKEEILISIIIPMYNCEKYIKRCIESVINQSYQNLEVVIVDDGSTDNSVKIAEELKNKYQKINIIMQENKGVSAARNEGIKASKGDYITFLDADDWLEKDFCEVMLNTAIKNNVDIAKCNYYSNKIYNKNYSQGKVYEFADKTLIGKEKLEFFDYVLEGRVTCAVYLCLIKSSILKEKKIRFKEDINMGEDKEFFVNLLINSNSIHIISKPLYHYFYNSNGAMQRKDRYERYIQDNIKLNIYLLQLLKKTEFEVEARIKILNNVMIASIERNIFHIYETTNFQNCIEIFDKYKVQIEGELKDFKGEYLKNTVLKYRNSINYLKDNKILLLKISYFIQKYTEKVKRILRKIKGKLKEKVK